MFRFVFLLNMAWRPFNPLYHNVSIDQFLEANSFKFMVADCRMLNKAVVKLLNTMYKFR